MKAPFFYRESISAPDRTLTFDEDTSKHIVQVLRMKKGDLVQVTDGRGHLITAEVITDHKKRCEATITDTHFSNHSSQKISIAISLLKNTSRFEWFLEKATEIGVRQIIPLICERTEKQHIRYDRLRNICISAMLQSQQVWMPDLQEPVFFRSLFDNFNYDQKFIAHCIPDQKSTLTALIDDKLNSRIILIGPEGDFSPSEVELAREHSCIPVSLGETRLRTETAGIIAAGIVRIR